MYKYISFVKCDIGRICANNEDNYCINGRYRQEVSAESEQEGFGIEKNPAFFAVFDGMGGASYGEVASLMAAEYVSDVLISDFEENLSPGLVELSHRIYEERMRRNVSHMGSTASILYMHGDNATVCNVGDSPIFLLRDGILTQLSVDHDLAAEEVRMGLMTPEEAAVSDKRHALTQYLGVDPEEFEIEPYINEIRLKEGDRFLICSDGISDMINVELIGKILGKADTVEAAANELVEMALSAGGKDNATALVVDVK